MIRNFAALTLGLTSFFLALPLQADVKSPEFPTIVRTGKLIDVANGRTLVGQCIFIDGETISQIAPCPKDFQKRFPAKQIIDWSAYTVLPGLIDLHTHLADVGQSADLALPLKTSPAATALVGAHNARITLEAGFTSVRDVGTYRGLTDVALRDAIDAGHVPGPRMFVAGAYITIPQGGGELNGAVPNDQLPADMRLGVASTPQEAAAKTEFLIANGADFIKTIATGAVLAIGTEPGEPELSEAQLRAVVDAAKAKGKFVTAHAHGAIGIKNAIRAGVRSIEHASLIDDEALTMAKASGTWLVMDIYNGDRSQGWLKFDSPKDEKLDPDPGRRPKQTMLHPEIDPYAPELSEGASPLFVAPPDVCAKTGRTILYGLIPVTSFEMSEAPPSLPELDQDTRDQLDSLIKRLYLPYYLHLGKPRPEVHAGKQLSVAKLDAILRDQSTSGNRHLAKFITSLQYLKLQFNAFDQSNFLLLLNQLLITTHSGQEQPLGTFLQQAARILVDREPGTIEMPLRWSNVTRDQRQDIVEMMRSQWMNRLAKITAGEGRYDALTARYQVRAFVRVKPPDGCPPKIIWSEYSNPFTIAPWYANNPDLPPVRITLPDILDAKAISAIKPNVAFAVPPRLFNFLRDNDDLKKLLDKKPPDGDGSNSDDSGFDWICSFNIPIITLCAYIVLNIFLKLFNFVFWWLFSIKICLPVPKGIFPKK